MRSFLEDAERAVVSFTPSAKATTTRTWQLIAQHRLAVQVEDVKQKTWHDPRLASLFQDEADVVGIDKHKSLLISWLGGVGKTTLVKQVYDSQAVKNYFNHHAWIMVSQSFTAAKLLCAVLKDFLEETKEPIPEGIDTMGEIQLINMLRDHLQQKRYVIVFDDVWSINASVVVKFALPNCCCGSRIVFTTQIGDVATSTETTSHVYQLQPLPEEEAWMPFCMKAFQGENNLPKRIGRDVL
ncbi:hypothetical protein CsSME_00037017 [Camellia sinensis var. sinensis]